MKRLIFVLSILGATFCLGCKPAAPEKHYAIQAEVISTNASRKTIMVKHGEIPGLMPAMTMDYIVADPEQLNSLHPRDKISADLVVSENRGRLEKIVLIEKAGQTSAPPSPAKTQ